MSLQGPLVVVAERPNSNLAQALADAGAFPIVEARWSEAPRAVAEINPSAVILADPEALPEPRWVDALARKLATDGPIVPVIAMVAEDAQTPIAGALPIAVDAPTSRLISRVASALRVRALHATVQRRAVTLKNEGGRVPLLPAGDPLDDATVLVLGRGRSYPALGVAVGERVGVVGALSVETAGKYLNAREIDGIVIGDGFSPRVVEAFLTVISEDVRFRDLPIAALGTTTLPDPENLPNFSRDSDPKRLVAHFLPLVRLHAFEARLKRMHASLECRGMLDPDTGLLAAEAFGRDLTRAIEDAEQRGVGLSIARFSFDDEIDRRTTLDAARLFARLMRTADFACRDDDGAIFTVFTETDLRAAHVVARRLASVLKHTMLAPERDRKPVTPTVTLATLKPTDSFMTLMSRVMGTRAVAAE